MNVAVEETLRAAQSDQAQAIGRYESGCRHGGEPGDRRIGVVWHTQGSGKSLTMAFYAGRVIREPVMANPTISCSLIATTSTTSSSAPSRADLRAKLAVEAGRVVFTTIQKFLPDVGADLRVHPTEGVDLRVHPTEGVDLRVRPTEGQAHRPAPTLSNRHNIIVIADEAHRSQYDFIDFIDGFARHMRDALPKASFIGFTGTSIELTDKNTRAVFGDYISVYGTQRAVRDKATVPIYYERRHAPAQPCC